MASEEPQVSRFRKLALIEGISFLLILLVTMPLKYIFDMPKPNQILGMVHGILFIAYILYLSHVWSSRKWPYSVLGWGLAAAIVPGLVFYVDSKIFKGLP